MVQFGPERNETVLKVATPTQLLRTLEARTIRTKAGRYLPIM